jgi:C-8 sterol isomerase
MGYIFDPERLHDIGRQAVGLPFDRMCTTVVDGLAAAYPDHIDTGGDWLFNLAGGLTGVMRVLHASLSEYVLIYGTPTGTEGFSGRYRIHMWDSVLRGSFSAYTDRDPSVAKTSRAGDLAHLSPGVTKAVRIEPDTWMLEYARGPIFTSLPMALGDSVFRAMDAAILGKTLLRYSQLTLRSLLRGKL